ncbi:MAG: glycosyltransferase family 39 protein [Patescibacteria group bacterium]
MSRLSVLARLLILSAIIFLAAVMMLKTTSSDSAITGEAETVTAGYSHIRFLDYRLDPEQPPLGKILAAAPLLLGKVSFPINSLNWQRDINGKEEISNQFFYTQGNDPDLILRYSRLASIAAILLLAILLYILAKDLIGKWWALLPSFLFAFSPLALAYGHYATINAWVTITIFAAVVSFLKFLESPSRKKMLLSGLLFGLAQITGFSALILIPYFVLILFIFYFWSVHRDWQTTESEQRINRFAKRAARYCNGLLAIFFTGLLIIVSSYALLTLGYPIEKQKTDTKFITNDFPITWIKDGLNYLSGVPALRGFSQYALGAAVHYRTEAPINWNPNFAVLKTFFLKEPIASLLLITIAAGLAIWNILRATWSMLRRRSHNFFDYLSTSFFEFSVMIFVGLSWAAALSLNSSEGYEQILPTLPFLYLLTAGGVRKWFGEKTLDPAKNFVIKIFLVYEEFLQLSLQTTLLGALIVGYAATTLIAYPHFLPFGNLFAGGTKNAYAHLDESDYNRGQDLKRLADWARLNLPDQEKIAVDYSDETSLKHYLGDAAHPWASSLGSPLEEGINWLAIPVTNKNYVWLNGIEPYDRVGKTITVYRLSN